MQSIKIRFIKLRERWCTWKICLSAIFLVQNDLFFYNYPCFISNLRVKNSNKKALQSKRICKSRLYKQLTECSSSSIASRKLQFTLNLVGTMFALWLNTRNNEWEVLLRVCPLLRNLRHRAKITPVRIALKWELSIDLEFNPML